MILRQRYRSTKDLWLYMTEKCKSSSFMLTILASGLPHASAEDLPPAVHPADPQPREEGAAAEGRAYQDGTSLAAAGRQVHLPVGHRSPARDSRVPARPDRQEREALPRQGLLLQGVQCPEARHRRLDHPAGGSAT